MTAISTKYRQVADRLGSPTGRERILRDGARYRHYQYGSIYWRHDLGAHEVHGDIHGKWQALGFERSPLGFPITDESEAAGGGRFNHFEYGSIYWRPDLGPHEVHGAIRDSWIGQGWERGRLGFPVTDGTPQLAQTLQVSRFEHGFLCWDPATPEHGAFEVPGGDGALLVIAPAAFRDALLPFVAHKRATFVPTFLLDREAITAHGAGRDVTESIKLFIHEGHMSLGVKDVMLVGDASLIPVRWRYTRVPAADQNWRDGWYSASDFYYGALRRGHRVEAGQVVVDPDRGFDDWDANADDHFDEHHWASDSSTYNPDDVDGCADVAVGRLPAHTVEQVRIYVDKVLRYESGAARPNPRRLSLMIDRNYGGGDSLARLALSNSGDGCRGRPRRPRRRRRVLAGGATAGALRLGADDEISRAAATKGWIFYLGHGARTSWNATDGGVSMDSSRVATYTNRDNLPIVISLGCSTGQFMPGAPDSGRYLAADGSVHSFDTAGGPDGGRREHVWDLGANSPGGPHLQDWYADGDHYPKITPPPPGEYDFADQGDRSFASSWVFNPNGGGIAYLGEMSVLQNNWGADLFHRVLAVYGGFHVLGDMLLHGQQRYWADFSAEPGHMDDCIGAPRIYLTYLVLFGDPSLRIG